MRLVGLLKALTRLDMTDVFQIIPTPIVENLSSTLSHFFDCQATEAHAQTNLDSVTNNIEYLLHLNEAQLATSKATAALIVFAITNVNYLTVFQNLDVKTICQSNKYLNMYGSKASVENLSWSAV